MLQKHKCTDTRCECEKEREKEQIAGGVGYMDERQHIERRQAVRKDDQDR